MSIVNINNETISVLFDINGNIIQTASDINGNNVYSTGAYVKGISYPFNVMSIVDASGITETSDEHTKNADCSIKVTPSLVNDSYSNMQTVTFSCDIPVKNNGIGFWMYISSKDRGVYNGNVTTNTLMKIRVTIGSVTKTLTDGASGCTQVAGMHYYYFGKVNETVNTIKVEIASRVNLGGCVYLDSIELGYRMSVPHILFNLDSSGKNFYSVGYPLFKKYGMTATFDYNLATTIEGDSSGTWDDVEDAQKHFEMINDGFDFGTYSGWISGEGTQPKYDADYDTWKTHAELMWKLNNNLGIYGPSTAHSSQLKSGEEYANAMVDTGYLVTRCGGISDTSKNDYCFINLDTEKYREIVPYNLGNVWDGTETTITNLLTTIDYAVEHGLNLMVMFHTIKESGYDHSSDTLNVGYNAIDTILSHCKTHVDKGALKVSTTSDFIKEIEPDLYEEWYIERSKSTAS